MKRNRVKILGAAVMMTAVLVTGCGVSGAGTVQNNTSGSSTDIGQEEAKKIALEDAGVQESDTTRMKISQDQDDGSLQYDVQFTVAEKEYDYEINGTNGTILSADVETTGGNAVQSQAGSNGDTAQNQTNSGNTANTANESGTSGANVAVSEADAKAAALERVSGATEADIRMELELDDGYYVYEGDIIYQQKEYEFEIDARTGKFLKWSEERY